MRVNRPQNRMVLAEELIRALGDQSTGGSHRGPWRQNRGEELEGEWAECGPQLSSRKQKRQDETHSRRSNEIRKTHLLQLQKGERPALTVCVEEPVACRMMRS